MIAKMGVRMLRKNKFKSLLNSETILLCILIGCILLSSAYQVTFFYGITFTFTSLFLFLLYRLFGLRITTVVMLGTFLVIKHDALHVVTNLILMAEILFVGIYFYIKKRAKMFFVDLFFWLTVGVISLYFHYGSSIAGDPLAFQVCKDILNGLFNVLMADMLLAYFPFYKFLISRKLNKNNVSIHQLLSHITILAIMIPFFLIILTKTWTAYEAISDQSKRQAEELTHQLKKEILELDRLPIESLDQILAHHRSTEFGIIITNSDNKIIQSNSTMIPKKETVFRLDSYERKEISKNFYRVLPMSKQEVLPIKKWRSGHFVFASQPDSMRMNIYIHYPISQYQDQLFQESIIHFKLSILFLLFTILIVLVANRLLVDNFKKLITMTTGLPQKVFRLEDFEWPQFDIAELRVLTTNLKEMSQKLKELAQESIDMNRILTEQTEKLKISEDKLHQIAYYDVLTALPNRVHFQNYVKERIQGEGSVRIAIIFIDLNQFKRVNDTLGHNAGDELLKLAANRLRFLQNDHREVFRLGGDEFVIVHEINDRAKVEQTLDGIQQAFSQPFDIQGQLLYISGSVGVSMFPENGRDLDTLVKHADTAMYVSKGKVGNPVQFYHDTMRNKFHERLFMESALRQVVEQGGFRLFYQPKLEDGVITSLESLLRWNDPVLGHVSPTVFIPLAEEIGLISKIDEWALKEACKQNKKWQDEQLLNVPISVNISPMSFQNDHLIAVIEKALADSGMSPDSLKLEITENVFIHDSQHVASIIHQIRRLGVHISIDDFGKGYSSLIHILQLPIDEIKIDQKFIKGIEQNEKQAFFIKSIIDMAHGLQLNIVAEGIETNSQREILIQMGCNELQGYLFSPPISQAEMELFLR
jgi:diguanylate cyclase (GGDEF)-like protein